MVSMFASHAVGHGFAPQPGHNKDHHKYAMVQTAALLGMHLTVQPNCLKCWVVCGTVYADMHFKDLLGSIARVGYYVLVPDFYLVLHGLRC